MNHVLLKLSVLLLAAMIISCGSEPTEEDVLGSNIDFEPDRPGSSDRGEVTPYSGDDPLVTEAQERFRTGLDLHHKVIDRTCSPNGGVCHNQKEYPDLHTPANFFSTISAPCNVEPGEWESVYDRCEQPGDRFKFSEYDHPEIEIGWLEYIPGEEIDYAEEEITPDAESAGLHIYLHDAVPMDSDQVWTNAQFIRTFVDGNRVMDLPFGNFQTRWWILDDGKHLMAEVRDYQVDRVNELMSVGIVQGDLNRNGEYGARESEPVSLIEAGNPEESYLIGRLRGKMQGERVPGSRMPLANQPLSIPEMLALYCFIEGLDEDATARTDGTSPIDYSSCSFADDPESLNLLGEGVTWTGRVSHILETNCGGCHSGSEPAAELDLVGDDAYDTLLEASAQVPELNLVEPGSPDDSYLWLKLDGDESIEGSPMPIDPLDGSRTLTDPELADIRTWIENGALDE
ncbi:MAG: hypothetical protein ACLFVJ_20290 [Persicimonas sp.]